MTLPSIDTRLLLRDCEINCPKLGRSGQSVRLTFGAIFVRQTQQRKSLSTQKKFVKLRKSTVPYDEADIFIVPIELRCRRFSMQFLFHPLPQIKKYQLKQNYYFIPRINLLTLWCFVSEVRRLFSVNRQKKRKRRKQRNTEPLLELDQNTAVTEISATSGSVKQKIFVLFLF